MGFLDRVRGFFKQRRERREIREFNKAKDIFDAAKDLEKQRIEEDKNIGERFGGIVKDLIERYDLDRKDAIERAREILDTPEDDLGPDDLAIIKEYGS